MGSKPKDRNTMNRNRLYLTAVFTGVLYIILVVNTPVVSGKEITKRTLNGQIGIINVNGVDSVPVSDEDKAPEVAPEPPNDSSENEILQKENDVDGEIAAEPQEGDEVSSRGGYGYYGYPYGGYRHYGKRSEEDPMFNDMKENG